jgi:serine/threonine protein kinase
MNIGDYTLSNQISDNSWEAYKTSYDENTGEPETQKYIVKKINKKEWDSMIKLIELSKITLSRMYIAVIIDIIENENNLYIVSEFVEGESLEELINNGLDDSNVILDFMNQIAGSIDYIHRNGIAHGNIKPSNIILDSEVGKLKLVDFSDSCCAKNIDCKYSGDIYYSPPETHAGDITFNEEAAHDMWSTGAVFYKMANNNKNYIDFSSNDKEIMLKDIKLLPVNESTNRYQPINEIINGLLDKNMLSRMTSTGLTASIDLARPGCEIDHIVYSRSEGQAILIKSGYESSVVDWIDNTICKNLTSEMKYCEINGIRYRKQALVNLCKNLGIVHEKNISGNELCTLFEREISSDIYKVRATGDLLNLIEISSKLTGMFLNQNQKEYYKRYSDYKELHLIDIEMLQDFQKDIYSKFLNYRKDGLEKFAKEEAFKNNEIVRMLLDFQPEIQEYNNYLI